MHRYVEMSLDATAVVLNRPLSRWQREADASVQQACAGDIKTLLLEFYWAICRPDRDWRVIKFDGVA